MSHKGFLPAGGRDKPTQLLGPELWWGSVDGAAGLERCSPTDGQLTTSPPGYPYSTRGQGVGGAGVPGASLPPRPCARPCLALLCLDGSH